MTNYMCHLLLIATLSAFLIILGKKWGFVEYVQVHGDDFFSKMFNCDFCLSFWAGAFLSVVWYLATGDERMIFAPFFTTTITRRLL